MSAFAEYLETPSILYKDKVRSKNWIRIRGFEDRICFEYSNLEDFRKVSENHFFSCKERYLVRPNPIGIKVKKIRTTNYLFIQVNAVHLTCFISSINCFVCLISRFVTSFLTKSGPGRETLGSATLKAWTSAGS